MTQETLVPHENELSRQIAEATGTRARAVLDAFGTLLERSWPVPAALEALRAATTNDSHTATVRRVLDALDAVHAQHETAMFWWKDADSHFLGFCPRLCAASGVPPLQLVGVTDADPRVHWNRQAALYMRDDREVLASREPRFDILERQDREAETVWLRTSKVPYASVGGQGTVGGFDTISLAEAQRLAKQAQRP